MSDTTLTLSSIGPAAHAVTSLNEKVQNLQKLLDSLDQTVQTLARSRDAVNNVVAALEELGGIAVRARDTLKTDFDPVTMKKRIGELENRFQTAMARVDELARSATFNGVNLLSGETLVTKFDAGGRSDLSTDGIDLSTDGLQIRKSDFSSPEKVQDTRIDIMNAIDIAVTLRHIISSDLILIQTRQEFSSETIQAMSGNEQAAGTDVNEEAANLLALQIRQQLEQSDVSLASEGQQYLLRQF